MALEMHFKFIFSHTVYSKPEDFQEDPCIQFLLDRTACTKDCSLNTNCISHLKQGHSL